MPIKDPNKYPPDWPERRERALQRTDHRCGFCGVKNHTRIVRIRASDLWSYVPAHITDAVSAAMLADAHGTWQDAGGRGVRLSELADHVPYLFDRYTGNVSITDVVLTTMHKDNALENHEDDNLIPGCQRCHLTHDAALRAKRRAEDAGQGTLL